MVERTKLDPLGSLLAIVAAACNVGAGVVGADEVGVVVPLGPAGGC